MQRRHVPSVVMMLALLLCLAVLPQTGCKKPKKKNAPAENRPSLLVPGEIDEIRKTLAAIAAENADKSCIRPVLRGGPALEGKADADMLALLAQDGVMKDCYSALRTLERSLASEEDVLTWIRDTEMQAQEKGEQTKLVEAKASIADLQEVCATLVAPLSKAVSHEDACSPYLPGRLGQGELLPFIALSKAAVLVARNLAVNGKQIDAVQLLLDTLRFGQDLSRGGTSLIEPMLAYASHQRIRPELDLRFDELSLDELRVIEGELTLLLESQPHYTEYFDGERDNMVIQMVWPGLEDSGWQPPGGYPLGQTGPVDLAEVPGGPTAQETAVFLWVVARDNAKLQNEQCKRATPVRACIATMDSHLETLAQDAKPDIAKLLKMATLSEADVRATVRKQIIDILRAVAMPTYSKYQMRMETMRIALVAQHNKVQSLIAAKTKQPCPAAFASSDEDMIPRVATQEGRIDLYLPQWIVDRTEPGPAMEKLSEPLAHYRCP